MDISLLLLHGVRDEYGRGVNQDTHHQPMSRLGRLHYSISLGGGGGGGGGGEGRGHVTVM